MNSMKPATAYLGLFALLFFCLTYAHQKKFDAPTPVSRLDLLHALVVQGTISIDDYHENTPDKAVFDGRYYSDKAPGTVALALLPFALAVAVLGVAGIDLGSDARLADLELDYQRRVDRARDGPGWGGAVRVAVRDMYLRATRW